MTSLEDLKIRREELLARARTARQWGWRRNAHQLEDQAHQVQQQIDELLLARRAVNPNPANP